ncbi:putative transcriptional regulator YheO [Serratia fonticola]|uniref:Putative transcriptional regulator YheO n=1 Tax=Serratia fonticola TaxID=47917 RepID=A0A542D3U6_SERFO|nr:putative transcriptional regulator YheO [Serratia fonticola]TQI97735.1 putative transcriptional regulator YheO [Serratia fonticola]TVZ72233.1 putative transcriptional regulator YheO [Serratia fonticola]
MVKLMGEIKQENALLLREAEKIVQALGAMFAPSCEVVLHDLTQPEKAIVAIANNLSHRSIGDAASEMGLERIASPDFPDVVQNYASAFPDGRPAKSTSIGLRNSQGHFVAAICLNLDVSLFNSVNAILQQLTAVVQTEPQPTEEGVRSLADIAAFINQFAASQSTQPRALSSEQRFQVIQQLKQQGYLQLRGAATMAAEALGISRVSVYNLLKREAS